MNKFIELTQVTDGVTIRVLINVNNISTVEEIPGNIPTKVFMVGLGTSYWAVLETYLEIKGLIIRCLRNS